MVQEMAQAHWEPPEPEPRVRVARLEQIPQFEWLYPRIPTTRASTQAHLRLMPPQLQCRQSTFVVIRSSSRFRVNHFAQATGKNPSLDMRARASSWRRISESAADS